MVYSMHCYNTRCMSILYMWSRTGGTPLFQQFNAVKADLKSHQAQVEIGGMFQFSLKSRLPRHKACCRVPPCYMLRQLVGQKPCSLVLAHPLPTPLNPQLNPWSKITFWFHCIKYVLFLSRSGKKNAMNSTLLCSTRHSWNCFAPSPCILQLLLWLGVVHRALLPWHAFWSDEFANNQLLPLEVNTLQSICVPVETYVAPWTIL